MTGSGETVGEIGERELLRRLSPWVLCSSHGDVLGAGDDCAELPLTRADEIHRRQPPNTLITTDLLIENTHFLANDQTVWQWVGRKAMGSNISDIAAMGGTPTGAVVALGVPGDMPVKHVEDLYKGMSRMARAYGVSIVGGDVARSSNVTIGITVFGTSNPYGSYVRSNARAGDYLYVSGPLGGSRAGLEIMLRPDKFAELPEKLKRRLVQRHFSPTPQVALGEMLKTILLTPVAAIDISDSLYNEAGLMAEASGVRLEIDLDKIPVHADVSRFCAAMGIKAQEFALFSGEEYELLVAIPFSPAELEKEFSGCWLQCIGRVTEGNGVAVIKHGGRVEIKNQTFSHFG